MRELKAEKAPSVGMTYLKLGNIVLSPGETTRFRRRVHLHKDTKNKELCGLQCSGKATEVILTTTASKEQNS